VGLAEQWDRIVRSLPDGWHEAGLRLVVPDPRQRDRAAALLGPLAPGRVRDHVRFVVSRESGVGPNAARRLLANLDEQGIRGTLVLGGSVARDDDVEQAHDALAVQWDAIVGALPDDWSDLLCRASLASSDDVPRAALLSAPLNPSRPADDVGFEFRVARTAGYGASPQMARRCLARMDEEGIPGTLELLRALSDTQHVSTQGPVWYVAGKVL
jgi:hypothetical protein